MVATENYPSLVVTYDVETVRYLKWNSPSVTQRLIYYHQKNVCSEAITNKSPELSHQTKIAFVKPIRDLKMNSKVRCIQIQLRPA